MKFIVKQNRESKCVHVCVHVRAHECTRKRESERERGVIRISVGGI